MSIKQIIPSNSQHKSALVRLEYKDDKTKVTIEIDGTDEHSYTGAINYGFAILKSINTNGADEFLILSETPASFRWNDPNTEVDEEEEEVA
jgi:hypothetical protein